jgi:ribulose-phosphate 3-epimerase
LIPPPVRLAVSVAAADLSRLGWAVKAAEAAGADLIHVDLEDGVFLPSLTFGPGMIRALRPHSKLPFDVHVELARPEDYLEQIAQAGADRITVHVEACPFLFRTLRQIRALGKTPGVAFNASTDLHLLPLVLEEVEILHLLTSDPDRVGQAFIPACLEKIREARRQIGDRQIQLQVDGGLRADLVPQVVDAGADVLVVGRAVWNEGDPARGLALFREASLPMNGSSSRGRV